MALPNQASISEFLIRSKQVLEKPESGVALTI
jgi:hypothetical protein